MLLQSSSSGGSTTYGVVALAVFLAVVFALGFGISRVHRFRHQRAWRPLVGLVDGRIESGMGPGSSVLRGTWRGHPVVASALPGSPLGPGEDETVRYNRLVLRLFGVSGAGDWRVVSGRQGWRVEAGDPGLVNRLDAAGLAALADRLALPHDAPFPGIAFSARDGHLELNADAGRGIVPPPDRFEALLDALVTLAGINTSVNGR